MGKFQVFPLAAILLAGTAHAGVYAEMSEHDLATGKVSARDKLYVQQGMARVESADGQHVTIFKNDAMIQIQPATKTFRVLDKASMGQMAGKMNDAMAKLHERMDSMPPEQRAAMEKMMGSMGQGGPAAAAPAHVYDAVDAGGSGSANGRSCHLWNATRDGKPQRQLCVVPASSLPGSNEVLAWMRNMADFVKQFPEAMRAQGGAAARVASNAGTAMTQEFAVMTKINGFPASSRGFDATGALEHTETVLTQWQQRDISASQFDIPAGFTQQDLMEKK
jgi:hypothetical protein